MARTIIKTKENVKRIVAQTADYVVHLLNQCKTKVESNKSTLEVRSGRTPIVSHLKVFGMFLIKRAPR